MRHKVLSFVSAVLSLCLILPMISVLAFAQTEDIQESTDTEVQTSDISNTSNISFTCNFDVSSNSINFSGTVSHEALIKYRDYTVEIYAVPIGDDAERIVFSTDAEPLAQTPISVRFQFSKKITSVVEKYYSYCVALCSEDGERILATDAKYAEVSSSYSYDQNNRAAYKGIESEMISAASNTGAGRMIIPIFIDRLISNSSSGYVYLTDDENIYFDKSYLDILDSKLRTATASGAQVYVKLLVSSGNGGIALKRAEDGTQINYFMPDVYDEKTLIRIEAAVTFISDRYKDIQSGIIDGIIIGSQIDNRQENYINIDSDETYTDMYALYAIVVANSSRRVRSEIDIVIPFSNYNSYTELSEDGGFNSAILLEKLTQKFDSSLSSGLDFTVSIEGDTAPLTLSADKEIIYNDDGTKLHANNMTVLDTYLGALSEKYSSAPDSFMFVWKAPAELRSNALSAAYAYSYLKLYACSRMSSFVVSFALSETDGNFGAFTDVKNIFETIDTEKRENSLKQVLSLFYADTWQEVLGDAYVEIPSFKKMYSLSASDTLPQDIKGSFSYFDFSSSVAFNNWYNGISCQNLRLDHSNGGIALRVDMTASGYGEYSELLCLYDYTENFVYTPHLAFDMNISTDEKTGLLFEVMMIGTYNGNTVTATRTVRSGERSLFVLDLSGYDAGTVDTWKISVRSLDGEAENFSLLIYDVTGYSTEYDSDTLAAKIEEARALVRNQTQDSENDTGVSTVVVIVAIAILVIALGVGIFVCIRQNDDSKGSSKAI